MYRRSWHNLARFRPLWVRQPSLAGDPPTLGELAQCWWSSANFRRCESTLARVLPSGDELTRSGPLFGPCKPNRSSLGEMGQFWLEFCHSWATLPGNVWVIYECLAVASAAFSGVFAAIFARTCVCAPRVACHPPPSRLRLVTNEKCHMFRTSLIAGLMRSFLRSKRFVLVVAEQARGCHDEIRLVAKYVWDLLLPKSHLCPNLCMRIDSVHLLGVTLLRSTQTLHELLKHVRHQTVRARG